MLRKCGASSHYNHILLHLCGEHDRNPSCFSVALQQRFNHVYRDTFHYRGVRSQVHVFSSLTTAFVSRKFFTYFLDPVRSERQRIKIPEPINRVNRLSAERTVNRINT